MRKGVLSKMALRVSWFFHMRASATRVAPTTNLRRQDCPRTESGDELRGGATEVRKYD
jgi:hypothetical protein